MHVEPTKKTSFDPWPSARRLTADALALAVTKPGLRNVLNSDRTVPFQAVIRCKRRLRHYPQHGLRPRAIYTTAERGRYVAWGGNGYIAHLSSVPTGDVGVTA